MMASKSSTTQPRILVAGLGNSLLTDDGVGVHAVRRLAENRHFDDQPEVVVVEVGTAVLDALHLFEWADHIVAIDAMRAGGEPGAIYQTSGDRVENPGLRDGLHELGLLNAMALIPGGKCPPISVIGIEPETIDYGLDLTAPVQAALPQVIAHTVALVESIQTTN